MKERVRFAPSPTGPLHIGGLRTALFNYAYAKKNNGTFILRIEDTDQKRKVEGSEEYITNVLQWTGLTPDEGPTVGGPFAPYKQSLRKEIYTKHIDQLIKAGRAYYAFDSTERLEKERKKEEENKTGFLYSCKTRGEMDNSLNMDEKELKTRIDSGEKYVVRFKNEEGKIIVGEDLLRGEVRANSEETEDKVLMKASGLPTYHFANVVDDYLMKITTVIRGEEWLPSLPLHLFLYDAFGWTPPKFIHLPLILNPSGKGKLSKRDGDKNGFPVFPLEWNNETKGHKEEGFLPEAHLNYIAQLGCSYSEENEIVSLEEIVFQFELKKIQKGGARFDFEKAKWINQQHLSRLSSKSFRQKVKPYLDKSFLSLSEEKVEKVLNLIQNRVTLLEDVRALVAPFYEAPQEYQEKAIKKILKEKTPEVLAFLEREISTTGLENFKEKVMTWVKENEVGMGLVMQNLRVAVMGDLSGPDIIEVAEILEKEDLLQRINRLNNHLK